MSNTKETVLTGASDDWQPLSDVCLDEGETQCLHCEDIATELVSIDSSSYWALCGNCSHESHCESMDAAAHSERDMDYYSGYE